MMSMHLTLLGLFHWLGLLLGLRVITINPPVVTSVKLGQKVCIVAQNYNHSRYSFAGSTSKSHQARNATQNRRT
jgi:hypothetical protein